jgi:hypothetical protein
LTTPAAQNGIHSIWIAHTATPGTPNSAKLMKSKQRRAHRRVRRIDLALDPVFRAALAVLLDRLAIAARFAIQLHAAPEDGLDALVHRAVRIFSVSHFAWCLRWIAAHSFVIIDVVIHVQKRKKCASTGWKSTPRCAWLRCRYSVTEKIVSCVATSR